MSDKLRGVVGGVLIVIVLFGQVWVWLGWVLLVLGIALLALSSTTGDST